MGLAEIKEIDFLLPYFIKHKNIWSDYDAEADTLYIHFKKPSHADNSEMTDDDVIIRYDKKEVIGLTILGASRRGYKFIEKRKYLGVDFDFFLTKDDLILAAEGENHYWVNQKGELIKKECNGPRVTDYIQSEVVKQALRLFKNRRK